MTTKGQELQVMLLASTGRDDVVVTATAISDIDESRPGHFSRLVRINRGQGVAFDGQTLSAEYNHAKSRWQVLHPCAQAQHNQGVFEGLHKTLSVLQSITACGELKIGKLVSPKGGRTLKGEKHEMDVGTYSNGHRSIGGHRGTVRGTNVARLAVLVLAGGQRVVGYLGKPSFVLSRYCCGSIEDPRQLGCRDIILTYCFW